MVGLRLADRSLAGGDCQRDHTGVSCQHFGDALALWAQGICGGLAPALGGGVIEQVSNPLIALRGQISQTICTFK